MLSIQCLRSIKQLGLFDMTQLSRFIVITHDVEANLESISESIVIGLCLVEERDNLNCQILIYFDFFYLDHLASPFPHRRRTHCFCQKAANYADFDGKRMRFRGWKWPN